MLFGRQKGPEDGMRNALCGVQYALSSGPVAAGFINALFGVGDALADFFN